MFDTFFLIAAEQVNVDALPHVSADSNEIQKGLSVVFTVLGGICLLIITIAGMRYMLARDDPTSVAQARNTILYALIGLVISASAFTIVNLVLKGL